MKDIIIIRKMTYDERRKILEVKADVTTKKSHKIEIVEYKGDENIRGVFDNLQNRKKNLKMQLDQGAGQISQFEDEMKDLKKKGVELTEAEEIIKASIEKIGFNMRYGEAQKKKEAVEKDIKAVKEDLRDVNEAAETIKQKVKNIKLE